MNDSGQMGRPLDGVRVLDLTHYVAGPYCTRELADYGASVLKIERPGGDPVRNWPPFLSEDGSRTSLLFLYLNHGKESLTLDLKTNEGREKVIELARDADVVVENFRPGTLDRMGLGWDVLHATNPRLVLTSISNFGQTGPYRDYKAWDIICDAVGGLAYIHGYPDREPLTHGNPQAQYRAGVIAATATVAALFNLDDGQGEHVDISVTEVVSSTLRDTIPQYTYMGAIRQRSGQRGGGPGAITPCADGYVIPSGYGGGDYANFARLLQAPELEDERFATGDGRQQYAAELRDLIQTRLRSWTMVKFLEEAQAWGFGVGIVMTPAQLLECEHWIGRGLFGEYKTESGRTLTAPRRPFSI